MTEPDNFRHHSCMNDFEDTCQNKLQNMSPEEMVYATKFIKLASRMGQRYPFVFLPNFIEDFMNGAFTRKITKKYNLSNNSYGYIVNYILKLKGTRSKDPDKDNKKSNLGNGAWKELYDLSTSQSDIFANELMDMFNCNILCALVGNAVLQSKYLSHYEIKKKVLDVYSQIGKDIEILDEPAFRTSFENHIQNNLQIKIDRAVEYLAHESYVISINGNVAPPSKYSKISDHIYDMLAEKTDGTSYDNLRKKTMTMFPLFKMSLGMKEFDSILDEFEKTHKIIRKRSFWKYSPDSDQLFTIESYDVKMKHVMKEAKRANAVMVRQGRTKFFGRIITPDQFISELKTLDLGDLDDLDDQVTRIAGLVLSDAVMLQSPREYMGEFDFVVDLTNYNFRPEQEEVMKKFDFVVTANIFHCKVMIDTEITTPMLSELKELVPDGEQGVIFTCNPVSNDVLKHVKDDRTVQIIGEDAIRDWCSITSTIPCRRHSVARIMYGEGIGKMVLVKSLNYESGLATVETTPDRDESTLSIGCLREVDLKTTESDDFEQASEEYFDFLCMLDKLSSEPLEACLDTNIINVHDTHMDLIKSTNPHMSDSVDLPHYSKKDVKFVEFDGIHVRISMRNDMKDMFECKCSHKLNEEHYATLCKHIVVAMNHICMDALEWDGMKRKMDLLRQKLLIFQRENVKRMIDALYYMVDSETKVLLKAYLMKHVDWN